MFFNQFAVSIPPSCNFITCWYIFKAGPSLIDNPVKTSLLFIKSKDCPSISCKKKKNPKNWWMHTAGKWQTACIYSNVIRFFIIQHDFAVLGWIYLILKGVCLVLVAKTGEIFHNVLHSPFRSIRVTGFLLLWRGPFFRLSLSFNSAIKTSKVHWYMTMELPVSLRTLTQFFSPVVILWRSCRVVWRW